MSERAIISTQATAPIVPGGDIPLVDWREALTTFLNTLSSPRTARAYQRAVMEAMGALVVDYVADITLPILAQ
jgi:hypothetical protein